MSKKTFKDFMKLASSPKTVEDFVNVVDTGVQGKWKLPNKAFARDLAHAIENTRNYEVITRDPKMTYYYFNRLTNRDVDVVIHMDGFVTPVVEVTVFDE